MFILAGPNRKQKPNRMANMKKEQAVTQWRHSPKSQVSIQYAGQLTKLENEFCSRLCAICEIFERGKCKALRTDTIESLKSLMADLHRRWKASCNECQHADCELKIKRRRKGFDDTTGIPGITSSGRRRLSCPNCGSRKYKYQDHDESKTLERRRAWAREHYRKLKSTPEGRAYLAAKSARFQKQKDKETQRRRIQEKRTIKKEGFTASDIQRMTAPQLRRNWKKIVGAE